MEHEIASNLGADDLITIIGEQTVLLRLRQQEILEQDRNIVELTEALTTAQNEIEANKLAARAAE